MNLKKLRLTFLMLAGVVANASGQVITTFSDLSSFNSAIAPAPVTLETFTPTHHFPISTGVLNSFTNLPGIGIVPGTIQPGVTYSTAIGTSSFFNIDAGGGFPDGGFLDTVTGIGPLTVAFTGGPVLGFGFDTSTFMGSQFTITINFTSGGPYTNTLPISSSTPVFYGFASNGFNIISLSLIGDNSSHSFGIDNFRFASIPEPSTFWFLGLGVAGLIFKRRRRCRD